MIAAIYARKSNEQNDVTEEQKSVTRQIEGAREFIAAKRWTLNDAHVYSDDGVSGALFATRPEFQRLMRDAEAHAFDAVVIFDVDRMGRNARHTMDAFNKLADLGITVWDYSTGQMLDLDSFEGETMTFMKARFAQQYRDQVRKHTRASHRRKAEQGLVTGGKLFGYDNVKRNKGETIRTINESEAAVVREIYARYAAGDGARTIAEALNSMGAPSPRAQQGRPNGWSVTTVRDVLLRPTYRGEVVYGRTRTAYGRELLNQTIKTKRESAQIPTPEDTWHRRRDDSLRIIDDELAARVDARRTDRRTRYLTAVGAQRNKRPENTWGKYLLTGGLLVCPTCGGHFEGIKYPRQAYVCSTRRRKPGACPNSLTLPMEMVDGIVLNMIEGEILETRFIEELLAMVDNSETDNVRLLTRDRDRLRGEIQNLVGAISLGKGAQPEALAQAIRDRELEVARIEARLRAPRHAPNIERLRDALTQRAQEWRATLRAEPKVARLLLRRLIGPLVLHDESKRPDFIEAVAEVKAGLIDGLAELPQARFAPRSDAAIQEVASPGPTNSLVDAIQDVASPSGIEPESRP